MKTQPVHSNRLTIPVILGALALLFYVPGMVRANNADIKLGPSCVTSECHSDIKGAEYLHGPVNMTQCEPCHIPIDNKHEFKPAAEGRDLCLTCHEVEKPKKVVHGPFQADCTLCHDPHGGNNQHFVKGGEGAGSCNLCHDSVTKDMTHLHGPVSLGECLACHSPHQSDNANLLVQPPSELCVGCHVDVQHELDSAVVIHDPVKQDCTGCHNPHGGKDQFFLPSEGSDLCLTCHGDFIEKSHQAKYPHVQMTEGKGCRDCHAPHASPQEGLLATDTETLCLSCHNKEVQTTDGHTVPNVATQLADSKYLHGPIRDRNCVACHKPHGSEVANILNKAFPADFYAPYKEGDYDLCFECHDRTLVLDPKTEVTGFRDGDRNLHYLHVNREKGRTCRACHDEHASNQPNHVRSVVPFGRWMMKLEFDKTQDGGTCETGCHVPKTYNRVKAVNPVTAQ